MEVDLFVNDQHHSVDVSSGTPLLWVLRDTLGLTGTKYGCGIGLCGACTVHLDGQAVRSCQVRVDDVVGRRTTTIEGLSVHRDHPVQRAWREQSVIQCGYCQAGQIMAAAALLSATNARPSESDISETMSAILCRCGTYQRIRAAIAQAAEAMQ